MDVKEALKYVDAAFGNDAAEDFHVTWSLKIFPMLLLTGCCHAPPSIVDTLTPAQRRALPHVNIPAPTQIYLYSPRPAPIWGPDR